MIFRSVAIIAATTTMSSNAFAFSFTNQNVFFQNGLHPVSSASPSSSIMSSSPRITSSQRRMSNPADTDIDADADISNATPSDNINDNEEEWWQSFQLKDSKLAEEVRADFPILTFANHFVNADDNTDANTDASASDDNNDDKKKLIYFDSAATSQKPKQVIQKITSYYEQINSNVHRGAHTLSQRATAEYEASRDKVQNLINAKSRNEIIFTSGATEALNLVASTYGRANIGQGDEILISELEHHSNIVPWQMLAEEKGATLKYIPIQNNVSDSDSENGSGSGSQCLDFDEQTLNTLITDKTKIVSIQHVSNVLACIHPIETLVSKVRQHASQDCIIILDACQSVPHMPVDVQSLDVDFIAASGHKICAPTGIGFLWGREEILNAMPPFMGGGEMIDEVYMDHSTYAPAPARFEAGTPQIAQAIGLGAAIDYIESIGGMTRIYNYEHELGDYLLRRMEEVEGITVLGPEVGVDRAAIVAFVCDNVHPSDLSTFLDMEGVAIRAGHHCCQPLHRALGYSHSARASLYFYNTKEEVDSFISILKETLAFLGGGSAEDGVDDDFVPFI
jgi:cysteine desulfurase/selenocysteine lyase